jgi:hypothetical protein
LKAVEDSLGKLRTLTGRELSLRLRLHIPEVDAGISYATETLQDIEIYRPGGGEAGPTFFYPNTTTFLELRADRQTTYVVMKRNTPQGP